MRYIKIRAKNYNDAMMKLRMDYGEDAIPISHKVVKEGGLFKSTLFAKDVVELTAAVQDKKGGRKPLMDKKKIDFTVDDAGAGLSAGFKIKSGSVSSPSNGKSAMSSLNKTIDDLNENLNGFKATLLDPRNHEKEQASERETVIPVVMPKETRVEINAESEQGFEPVRKFEKEFDEIKNVLNKIVSEQQKGGSGERQPCGDVQEEKVVKPLIDILRHNDFDLDESTTIINEVKNSMSRDDLKDRYKIQKNLKDLMKTRIVTTGPFKTGNKKKIIMFMGPTGVGKTTTMAKLGAIYSLREGHSVAFVTLDNYRIAATEQLKKYAEIMNIPVHVVNNHKEFRDVIGGVKSEIIMVDTSGRSHRNELKISEIKSFADTVEYDFDKVLCVSANTKKSDLNDIFRSFDVMHFNNVIITKVDETSYIGNVIDMADKYNKPISYYTNGQEVPNDIVVADPDKIVDMMIGTGNN